MGSDVLQFLTCPSLHNPVSSPLLPRFPLNNSTRCSSTSSGCRGHSNSRRRKDYQGFSWDEEIRANDKGEDFGFGKRIWWSDEYDIEDEEEAGIDGFGTMDASIGFAWVIKVQNSVDQDRVTTAYTRINTILSYGQWRNIFRASGNQEHHCGVLPAALQSQKNGDPLRLYLMYRASMRKGKLGYLRPLKT